MAEMTDVEKKEREKLLKRGKIIAKTVAAVQVLNSLLVFVLDLGVLSLIVNLTMAVLVFLGVKWARYLVGVLNIIGIFTRIFTLVVEVSDPTMMQDAAAISLFVIESSISILMCMFISYSLLFSRSVSEFLHYQKYDMSEIE